MKSLTQYLMRYREIQEDIKLVYHPKPDSTWRDRCDFLGEGYSPHKPYNHRQILRNEVVIEYDEDDPDKNLRLIQDIEKRLKRNNIAYSLWFSGGKSYHLHIMLDIPKDADVGFVKRMWVFHFTTGLPRPDMQLFGNHLIRAEYGVHEKTQRVKKRLRQSPEYPLLNHIPENILNRAEEFENNREEIDNTHLINSDAIKLLSDANRFRQYNDGKERAMFILIHVLKQNNPQDKVIKWIQQWYKDMGGTRMREQDIETRVRYHWSRPYILHSFINDLLKDIGAEEYLVSFIKD